MDRKQFLRSCAGACACIAGSFAAEAEAETPDPDGWKLPFVKQRYAHLIELLSNRMTESDLAALLHDQGAYCSSLGKASLEKYRGDVEAYAAFMRKTASGGQRRLRPRQAPYHHDQRRARRLLLSLERCRLQDARRGLQLLAGLAGKHLANAAAEEGARRTQGSGAARRQALHLRNPYLERAG